VSGALARAVQLAPAVLYRETRLAFSDALTNLVPKLFGALKIQTPNSTATGLAGAPPSAQTGASKDVLAALGLDFLPIPLNASFGAFSSKLQAGLSRARDAGKRGDADRDLEVETAARELAQAVGGLVRLILQGIVVHLLNGSTASNRRGTSGEAAIGADVIARLVGQLRSSSLDASFAIWVENNWRDLLTNPELRIKPTHPFGGKGPVEKLERKQPPEIPVNPPAIDPPTFSPNISLLAQAASLVAAAAQGAPFCPE